MEEKSSRYKTKKSVETKALIKKHSRDFGGALPDVDVIRLAGVSKNAYYKYKKEIIHEE